MSSVPVIPADGGGTSTCVGNGRQLASLGNQRGTALVIGPLEIHRLQLIVRLASQHPHQQNVALLARLDVGSPIKSRNGLHRLLIVTGECVAQGEVAACIQIGRRRATGAQKSLLRRLQVAQLHIGDGEPIESRGAPERLGGVAQQGFSLARGAQAQLRGAKPQPCGRVLRSLAERLLEGLLRPLGITRYQPRLAQAVPGVEAGVRLLSGALIESGSGPYVATTFHVLGQLHQPRIGAAAGGQRRLAGTGGEQQAGQQQRTQELRSGQEGHSRSRTDDSSHSIGHRDSRPVWWLRNVVISRALALFAPPAAVDSGRRWLAGLALFGSCCISPAWAEAEAPWAMEPYAYVVVDQEVRATLEAFGRNLDLPMDIAAEVKGKAQGGLRADTAGEFLDRLCNGSGLSWFYDGRVLHVTSLDALSVRQMRQEGVKLEALRDALDDQGVVGQHLGLEPSVHGGGELMIAGPPPYLALVERTLTRLRPPAEPAAPLAQQPERGVRVFRGSAPVERVSRAGTGGTN